MTQKIDPRVRDKRRKIVDMGEIKRWYDEGKTYRWMVEEYRRKYGIEITVSGLAQIRSRQGWERRCERYDDLLPWRVREEHLTGYAAVMLRAEARRRRGEAIHPQYADRLPGWLRHLEERNVVVHYEPDLGWFYVPREVYDDDIIRRPERVQSKRVG